jgi:acyl-CoA reductase-like NAD-dependent aldehyde dehydrogenase
MLGAREETFADPPHHHFADDDEAIALRQALGLQAAVFTSSLKRAFHIDRLRMGSIVVNTTDFWGRTRRSVGVLHPHRLGPDRRSTPCST